MAIVSVRTELIQTVNAPVLSERIKTELVYQLDTGTGLRESNVSPGGSAVSYLGRALNFIGNSGSAREDVRAFNNRASEVTP